MNGEIRIEYVALGSVARWPRNPKLHDHDALGASVDRFGFVQPLLVDERTGQLVAGHGRLETLQKRKAEGKPPPGRVTVREDGEWMVPLIRGVAFATETEAEAYLLADNRLSEIGGWNEEELVAMLSRIDSAGTDDALAGVGWSMQEVERLLRANDPETAVDPRDLDARLTVFEQGEIKQVVLYFDGTEYDSIIERLRVVMESQGMVSHTEAFKFLLAQHEANRSNPA